jgi:hypothetical protein
MPKVIVCMALITFNIKCDHYCSKLPDDANQHMKVFDIISNVLEVHIIF